MNLIVFGAGGFIGGALSNKLNSLYNEVYYIGLDIDSKLPKDRVYDEKIENFDKYTFLVKPNTIVYYLLNTISPSEIEVEKALIDLNLLVKYLDWAKDNAITRTIFTSSGGTVYESSEESPLYENSPLAPLSFYGMSKLCSEEYIKFYQRRYDLEYTILRIANPYGPGQKFIRNQGLIPMIVSKIRANEPITIYGDGSMIRDYIYIDDLINAMQAVLNSKKVSNRVLNVGNGIGVSILEVVESIETTLGIISEKNYLEAQGNFPANTTLNIDLIKSLTDWAPKVDFQKGVNQYIKTLSV